MRLQQNALLWLLFFLVCLGLGYPAVKRYDPAQVEGTSDAAVYRDMVVGGRPRPRLDNPGAHARLAACENYYRVLVPSLAKPVYWLARGHVGIVDAALLGLLAANAIFVATAASLLVGIGRRLAIDQSTALLAATLYLLDFCVANLAMAGLVDSGEACFLLAVAWSLLVGRWPLLPMWTVFGSLAKETFVPLAVMFALGWWMAEVRRGRLQAARLLWIAAAGVAGISTVTLAMSWVAGGLVWPWQFAAYMNAGGGFLEGLRGCLFNHTFAYVFAWLLPLGLWRVRRLPPPWAAASAAGVCALLALGAYNHAAGNTARALFNIAGPFLSLSAAIFLAGLGKSPEAVPRMG